MNKPREFVPVQFEDRDPMNCELVTQPNCALSLRQILDQYSQGDVSVRAHVPVNDFRDELSDDEFDESDDFTMPQSFADELEGREYLLQSQEVVNSSDDGPASDENLNNDKDSVNPEESQEKVEEN